MGRIIGPSQNSSDAKSRLVLEICAISTAPVGCPHRRRLISEKSHFIDWYRILRVAEDAGLEVVKKQYHKLALQLHPDKNKHPNAEIAFKLVSEAYSCLSDGVRRKAFNLERCKNFCIECNGISYKSCNSPTTDSSKPGAMDSRSRAFKDMRDRFREETRIIENCLKNNSLRRKETPLFTPSASENPVGGRTTHNNSRRESPVFDPGQYLFNGYPHLRSQVYKKPESLHHFHRGRSTLNYGRGSERFQSPVFETVPGRGMFKSKSVCIRS